MEQSESSQPRGRIEVSVAEARIRFMQLIRMIGGGGRVAIVLDDDGRPVAAIVPADAARSRAEMIAERERARSVTAGWVRRLEEVRAAVCRQHSARITVQQRALADTWRVLDDRSPPGTDQQVDRLRAVYRDVLV